MVLMDIVNVSFNMNENGSTSQPAASSGPPINTVINCITL